MTSYSQRAKSISQDFRTKMESLFHEAGADFFVKHPEVKTISWTQYVPTFNDGDPCEFTLGEVYYALVDWQQFEDPHWPDNSEDSDGKVFGDYHRDGASEELKASMKEFSVLLYDCKGVLETLYGSNVWVRLHASGAEVDEFDCGY